MAAIDTLDNNREDVVGGAGFTRTFSRKFSHARTPLVFESTKRQTNFFGNYAASNSMLPGLMKTLKNVDTSGLDDSVIVENVLSEDLSKNLEGTKQFLKIILSEALIFPLDAPSELYMQRLDRFVDAKLLQAFVRFIEASNDSLKLYSLFILTNILPTNNDYATKIIVDADAVQIVLNLLKSPPRIGLKEYALHLLANISLSSIESRDHILERIDRFPMLELLKEGHAVCGALSWNLYLLCRYPIPASEKLCSIILPLHGLLKRFYKEKKKEHKKIVVGVCHTLAILSYGELTCKMVEVGLLPILAGLVMDTCLDPISLQLTLRTIGNIIIDDKNQIKAVLDHKLLQSLYIVLCLHQKDEHVLHEACWVVLDIISSDNTKIKDIFENKILGYLVDLAALKSNLWPAVYALSVAAVNGSDREIQFLVEADYIKLICKLLLPSPVDLKMVMLEGLYNVLNFGDYVLEGNNKIVSQCTLNGCWKKLQALQQSGPDIHGIAALATEMLERYFVPHLDQLDKDGAEVREGDDG
ncbi:hypothetical protein OROMI_027293 [Orobanche minor]